jgi:hypothetical protein
MKYLFVFITKTTVLFVLLLGLLTGSASALSTTTIKLSTTWKFQTDPTDIGATTGGWYNTSYNDASWGTILSGKSWESQGHAYAGYAWYRQYVTIPAPAAGGPVMALTLNLGSFISDDDVWFNGMPIGGITGAYKYSNLQNRSYTIPSSLINYGGSNTIAIRMWGGSMGLAYQNSGLIAGTYTAVLDPFHVSARNKNATVTTEVPLQLYDLSFAQKGETGFELVFRYPSSDLVTGHTDTLTCTLTDFYGGSIATATSVPVTLGTDGILRGIVTVSPTAAQNIYLAGRFQAVLVLKDTTSGTTLSSTTASMDHLLFAARDNTALAARSPSTASTPYGTLSLIDQVVCSTSLATETHPYMQGVFGQHNQDYCTPGGQVSVPINTIMGYNAREPAYGWFAYRIGAGAITPGATYVLRIQYPEDVPRFCEVEIQNGHNYMDVGWKNGVGAGVNTASTNPYDPWPLSGAWQYYDVMVTAGEETTGGGGTGDDTAQNGFWVYVMNKVKPASYFSLYAKGPAIYTMRLYAIDPVANAPAITLPPATLPQRVMTFDWERQVEQSPTALVNYAKLMGYSAISPNILKWTTANYGDPTNGYDTMNIDAAGYWVQNLTINPATAPIPGVASVHQQYLAATKNSGINYIPRIEYGGSLSLPSSAWAINNKGVYSYPDRFTPAFCANLLNSATYTDMKAMLDSLIKPNIASNPQLTGILWRMRENRMPVSYGPNDVAAFCAATNTTEPTGDSQAQLAAWASTGTVGTAYSTWWQGQRASFHQQIETLLQSYRSNMSLYYYNWDEDKFAMMEPDFNSEGFFSTGGGATTAHYNSDVTARKSYTVSNYTNIISTGNFSASFGAGSLPTTTSEAGTVQLTAADFNQPNYALRPSLYANIPGVELFAPANYYCYANLPTYLNYFQTSDGLAVSNCVSYDELAAREPNPKYEGTMVLPGGGSYSMEAELLGYFYGDARTLTYTAYTYGRGFADAHRRFAQAFRALPASGTGVTTTVVTGTPTNIMERTYATSNGVYVGLANNALTGSTAMTVVVPGQAGKKVTNLVTNTTISSTTSGSDLHFSWTSTPYELDAFLVK